MSRPRMCRRINFNPRITYYKPWGAPIRMLSEVIINRDELEAIRLCDEKGLKQEEAAREMNISQPTLNRLLTTARKKIANALINGKAIRISDES